MTFGPRDALASLDGWTLTLTCSVCGKRKEYKPEILYAHVHLGRAAELRDILPEFKHCGHRPSKLVASCTWLRRFRPGDVPAADLTSIMTSRPPTSEASNAA